MDEQRAKFLSASAPAWGPQQTEQRDKIAAASDWPEYRTDPGTRTTPNDPMLLGGQGGGLLQQPAAGESPRDAERPRFRLGGLRPRVLRPRQPGHRRHLLHRRGDASRRRPRPAPTPRPGDGPPRPGSRRTAEQRVRPSRNDFSAPRCTTSRRTAGRKVVPGLLTLKARCPVGSTVFLTCRRSAARHGWSGGEWQALTASRRAEDHDQQQDAGARQDTGLRRGPDRPAGRRRSEGRSHRRGAVGCLDAAKLATAVVRPPSHRRHAT